MLAVAILFGRTYWTPRSERPRRLAHTVASREWNSLQTSGSFTIAPGSMPAGTPTTFVYAVTLEDGEAARLREIEFSVAPANSMTIYPTRAKTNSFGNIILTVTSHQDYRGEGTIEVTDVLRNSTETPVHFTVVD